MHFSQMGKPSSLSDAKLARTAELGVGGWEKASGKVSDFLHLLKMSS